jgi:hypothetical protein
MNTDPSLIMTNAGMIIGLAYCVIKTVGDIRFRSQIQAHSPSWDSP